VHNGRHLSHVCSALSYSVRCYGDQLSYVKEVDLYSAFIEVPHTQGIQVQITQCYLQNGGRPPS